MQVVMPFFAKKGSDSTPSVYLGFEMSDFIDLAENKI
jgi:hypothetical protein